ncbi:MAG: YHS domain-containing (seleno)protein [Planctomycetota bacterium]
MKPILTTAILAVSIVTVLTGCETTATTQAAATPVTGTSYAYHNAKNLPASGVALDGYCPVAYFAVNDAVLGDPKFASTHDGVTYHFVSADAKHAFDSNPAKYVPAYGGWCAFGMAVEDKFPVDPRNFKIVNNRLMLFLRNPGVDALELWNDGDEYDLTRKADAHWAKVQG